MIDHDDVDRRAFLKTSVAASTGAAAGFSFEEQQLLTATAGKANEPAVETGASKLPFGNIGHLTIS